MGRGSANSGTKGQKARARFTHHKAVHGRGRKQPGRTQGKTTKGGDRKQGS